MKWYHHLFFWILPTQTGFDVSTQGIYVVESKHWRGHVYIIKSYWWKKNGEIL